MFEDYGRELLRAGIIAAKSRDRELARHYIERAIYALPNGEHDSMAEAWFWLSEVVDEPAERRRALENAISHNFQHARARRGLAMLDGRLKADEVVDPDHLPAVPKGILNVDVERLMCPRCGGRMTYRPDGHSVVCEYCTRAQFMGDPRATPADRDFLLSMATARGHGKPMNEQALRCEGCGARILVPAGQLSVSCPYCGSPHVVRLTRARDLLAPDGIIPHEFTRQHAGLLLQAWLRSRKIKAKEKPAPPRGLYLPLWIFEVGGMLEFIGERTEMGQQGRLGLGIQTVRVHEERPLVPRRVMIPASRKLSAVFTRLIGTYNFPAVQSYDPRYLADWPAELYDIAMADASLDARSRAYQREKQALPASLDGIRILSTSSARLAIESFQLVLLPVWLNEVVYDGRTHIVLVNGASGDVEAEHPENRGRTDGRRRGPLG